MPDTEKSHDVFLSFNSEDKEAVECIAVYLEDETGLRPWFDQWEMIPGESVVMSLERGLSASKTCAVFVGKSGEGPWQRQEMESALQEQAKDPKFRVIPVLLPDFPHDAKKPTLPKFLSKNIWVSMRNGLEDTDALWRLECGIRGVRPGRGPRKITPKENRPVHPEPTAHPEPVEGRKEQEFSFDVITVNERGEEIDRQRRIAQQYCEDLGNGVMLEMVAIPGGSFLMGAEKTKKDSRNRERPQHRVTLEPFYLGKYPVTQAKWKAVVEATTTINLELHPEPSKFKGAQRPVERVTWDDAVEFCQRLSVLTGQRYGLPSEAQWEYACRAGTTTPFHYGATITADLANYDARETYASELAGTYREQTTDVGSFPPNAFGLYDMHGNVWEWCADGWHDNYDGAPTDGSVWQTGSNVTSYVLRGGSWSFDPQYLRCAYRVGSWHDGGLHVRGFRLYVSRGAVQ